MAGENSGRDPETLVDERPEPRGQVFCLGLDTNIGVQAPGSFCDELFGEDEDRGLKTGMFHFLHDGRKGGRRIVARERGPGLVNDEVEALRVPEQRFEG